MIVASAVAQFLGVNCWAVAHEGSAECVLFDAGLDGAPELAQVLEAEGLTPVAMVLTHGHPDHILGIQRFTAQFGQLPAYLHSADHYRLENPAATMSPEFKPMLEPFLATWQAPAVTTVEDGSHIQHAGLDITVIHTPGHTEGSSVFVVKSEDGDDDAVLMTGDVLFAGSIGRTDLPGSDPQAMQRSLQTVKELPDYPVYPGHGPATRIAHELKVNPFL